MTGFFNNAALMAGMVGRANLDNFLDDLAARSAAERRNRLEASRGPSVNLDVEYLKGELAKANATIDRLERKYRKQIAITEGWMAACKFLKGIMLASGLKEQEDLFIENISRNGDMVNEPTRLCHETIERREKELIEDYEKARAANKR